MIDAHLAILRAGVVARLEGAGPEVSARAAEYQLRILGMGAAEAKKVRSANERKANASAT